MPVSVALPGALADVIGTRRLEVDLDQPATIATLLQTIAGTNITLYRRLCDETGTLRRFVNIYVDGEDIRQTQGQNTPLPHNAHVQILPSIAGG
jgi:sulfur-carrier protein